MTVQQAFEFALQHHQAGRIPDAEAIYRQILAADPRHSDALHFLGVIAHQVGQHVAAIELIRQAIALSPGNPTYHSNLGIAFKDAGRLDEAIAAYRQAITLKPSLAEGYNNLGNALRDKGQLDEAIAAYHQAIALKPDYADPHSNLGNALRDAGQPDAAVAAYRNAIALKRDFPVAHNNLGNALREQGHLDQAVGACRQAIALNPDFPEAHSNLGNIFKAAGRIDDALTWYRRAIALKPDYTEAHSTLIFALDLLESVGVVGQQEERRRWDALHARRFAGQITSHRNDTDPHRKLRVGYVSADFRRHSASHAFAPVLGGHDPLAFDVFCYSGVKREDDVTARLRAAAHGWSSTLGMSDDALAEQIRHDRIDILVDLSGHSAGNRLLVFARKPAPVQLTAWGHATGTGLATMDYFFADPTVVPLDERPLFAEEIFDLPCTLCYQAPDYLPEPSALPSLNGLPLTFACMNRIEKITNHGIALWGRILHGAPGSRLLLKDRGFAEGAGRQLFLDRLRQVGGIEHDRVMLLGGSPHADHLRTFHMVDVALDPFPQNGGISTAEALAMGVPVVSLKGSTPAGRITESLLNALSMQQWVAQSEDDYVRIALEAAQQPARLALLRQQLPGRVNASPWGDVQQYTRAVEKAYRQIWQRWCAIQAQPVQDCP